MRITFVLPGYPYSPIGGFRVVYEYANQLVARGHHVTVIHPRRIGRVSLPLNPYRLARRLAGMAWRGLQGPPSVTWHVVNERVDMHFVPDLRSRYVPDGDVVVATWWETAEAVFGYPPSKGAKFYLIQHYEIWGGPAERVDATWRLPMHKVVIARWLYEKGMELGVPPSQMRHIPNGLNHWIYRVLIPIETRPKRVAMLYHPAAWKGGRDGIRALQLAKERHPDLRAVFFGTGAKPPDLPPWIEYRRNPPQDDLVRSVYNGSSIYLCPSWTEGWHLPPAEAMACGCALVSTDIGGVRDYASEGDTALLAPPRQPEALASRLIQALDNDSLRQRLARSGVRRILEFTWERSAALLEAWLWEVVRSGKADPGSGAYMVERNNQRTPILSAHKLARSSRGGCD